MAEMQTTIQKMDVESLITQRIPEVETVLSASNWFKDEEMTLDFGEYVGRPHEKALLQTSLITYFLANGWKIKEVTNPTGVGEWKSTSNSNGTNGVVSNSQTEAYSSAGGSIEAKSGEVGETNVSKSESEQEGDSFSKGTVSSTGSYTNNAESSGAPYWVAYQTVTLTRRKMQSELVLNDMIASFTKAYNEGRSVNNARYDELVALYSLMLSYTENEANAIPVASIKPEDFIALGDALEASMDKESGITLAEVRVLYNNALTNVREAIDALNTTVKAIPAEWLSSREADINRQFDAKISQANAAMAANGTFASSAWANILAGFERDRAYALNNLADTAVTIKVDTYGKVTTLVADSEAKLLDSAAKLLSIERSMFDLKVAMADVRAKLMESAVRVTEALQKNRIGLTEIRNTVLKWMFDFMERREDDYPGLEQLATIADRLGYSDGAVGGSISS